MSKSKVTKADVKLLIDQMKAKGEVVTRAEVDRRLKKMFDDTSMSPNTLKLFMREIADESSTSFEKLPEKAVAGFEVIIKEIFATESAKISLEASEKVAEARADLDAVDIKNEELRELSQKQAEQIDSLKETVTKQEVELGERERKLNAANELYDKAIQEREDLTAKHSSKMDELKEAHKAQLAARDEQIKVKETEAAAIKLAAEQAKSEAQAQQERLSAKITELSTTVSELTVTSSKAEGKAELLTVQLKSSEDKSARLAESLAETKEKFGSRERELKKLLEERENELKAAQQALNQAYAQQFGDKETEGSQSKSAPKRATKKSA